MSSIFEKIINVLNTPIPGTGAHAPAKTVPSAPVVPGALIPAPAPAHQENQHPAIDIQAEMAQRAAALKDAQKAAEDAELKRQLGEQRQQLEDMRRQMEHQMASEAQTHATTDDWTYTIQRGDTLSHIALRFCGKASRWPEIFDANKDKIKNPNLIYPGQVLVIPHKND
jgi:nucleoid-associated protein YgaU